jgi:hypothetical protein
MKTFYFILILLISFTTTSVAQHLTQTLRGEVTDAFTKLPIPGATIIILGTDPVRGTVSNPDGQFRFDNVPLGRTSISVSMIGYHAKTVNNLLVISGKEMVINVSLDEQVVELNDIEVTANKKDQPMNEMALISARSFTVEQTERYAGSLGDPSRMAQNFAGVSSAGDQRNDIIIRGNSPQGLLWRLEGIDIPNPNHFGSMGSTGGPVGMLNNNLLANSDFYTGAFPAEFGNALAGAFDLRLRNGNNEEHEFMGQVGFNGFELGAEGPISRKTKASYLVNVRYSTLEVFSLMGMDFGTGAAIPQYKDVSFKLNFPTKNGRITLFGLGGDSYIEMLDSKGDSAQFGFSGTDLRFGAKMGVAGLTHVHYFNNQGRVTTNLAVSGHENNTSMIDFSVNPDIDFLNEHDYEIKYTFSTKYSQRINQRNFFNTGIVFDYFDVYYNGKQYVSRIDDYRYYMDTDDNLTSAKAHFEWQHRFSNQFTLNTGLHATYLFLNGSQSLEPRAALKWQADKNQAFSLGAGLHSQSQLKPVYFMQLHDSLSNTYTRTNENLGFSKSLHLVAGYDLSFGNNHRLKFETYYQHLYNIPVAPEQPQYSILNSGGGFSYNVFHNCVNEGLGRNMGVELTLEKFLDKGFYYLLTASVFDAKYTGNDGVWRNSLFNNNFVFNALGGYEWQFSPKTSLSADLKGVWAGGSRFLPINEELSKVNNSPVYDWDNINTERYPDYFRINARITLRLNGKRVNQEWGLDLQNITNHQNIFTQNWNSNKKEVSTSYQMGFMPMMTYKIFF